VGKILVLIGLVVTGIGALIMIGLPLGRLPGDLILRRENFTVYVPIVSSIVLSLIVTLLIACFRR
jgi:predicted MFS family arabinose efflux permease|tara:strand:- start:682 stop:876 length:195 start_codon:yes stop_codon:yes gene_type:complete